MVKLDVSPVLNAERLAKEVELKSRRAEFLHGRRNIMAPYEILNNLRSEEDFKRTREDPQALQLSGVRTPVIHAAHHSHHRAVM